MLRANQSWFKLDFAELWDHRDLLKMLVRRDLIARYQQTLLGPACGLRSILPCLTIQLKSDRAEAKYSLSVLGANVCLALHAKNESEETSLRKAQ